MMIIDLETCEDSYVLGDEKAFELQMMIFYRVLDSLKDNHYTTERDEYYEQTDRIKKELLKDGVMEYTAYGSKKVLVTSMTEFLEIRTREWELSIYTAINLAFHKHNSR